MRNSAGLALATVTVLLAPVLAGCRPGATTQVPESAASPTGTPSPRSSPSPAEDWRATAAQALEKWSTFPVDADPRPIVPLGETADLYDFGNDSDAKQSFFGGNWTGPAALPSSPAKFDGYPVITARQGLDALRTYNAPGSVPGPSRLRIIGMHLASVGVSTDRGEPRLPVWRFRITHVRGYVSVPAIAPPAAWLLPTGADVGDPLVRASTVGQDLTVSFIGGAPGIGPCTSDYQVQAIETDHAVAYHLTQTPHPIPSGSGITGCSAVGYIRHATVHLSAPLRNRILLDAKDPGRVEGPVRVDPRSP